MKVGLISDVHLQRTHADEVERELAWVVDHFDDEFRPDVTVVLGDLIEDEGTAQADRRNLRRVTGVLEQLDSSVRYLLGNHDVMSLSRAAVRETLDGAVQGTVEVDGRTLVFLDSSAPRLADARGELDEKGFALLERVLPSDPAPIVFVHHPLGYRDLRDNAWFAETPEQAFCGNKAAVTRLFERHGRPAAVFNGHLHEADHTTYRGVEHVTVDALGKWRPGEYLGGRYAEVTLDGHATVRIKRRDDLEAEFAFPLD